MYIYIYVYIYIVSYTTDMPMDYDEDEESDSALLDDPVEETGDTSGSTLATASSRVISENSRRGNLFNLIVNHALQW